MRFYYISIISLAMLAVIYLVGTVILFWIGQAWRKHYKRAWLAITPFFMLLYAAPVAEEFWIAWNFGRLCKKDAGIFVYKTVEVEGFYDDVMGWGVRQLTDSGYQFMESKSAVSGTRTRVQVTGEQDREAAIAWYDKNDPGKKTAPDYYITYEVGKGEQIIVSPDRTRAWRSSTIELPTARYHYKWPHMDTPMSHKVAKIERVVEDAESNELMARETKYKRQAPWFYIGLDRPVMLCPAPGEHPLSKYGSVFNLALKPKQK